MASWHWPTYIMLFTCLFSGCAALHYADKHLGRKKYMIVLFFALLPTYLILANRGMAVGIDLVRYQNHVVLAAKGEIAILGFMSEPLMQIIYYLSNMLPMEPMRNFIFLTVTIQYVFIYIAMLMLYRRKLPTAFTFGLLWSFVMIRSTSMVSNALALACSAAAYAGLLGRTKKARIWYWICTAIAIGFHNSALINIPLFFVCSPLSRNRENRRNQLVVIAVLIGCYLLLYVLMASGVFNSLLPLIAGGQYAQDNQIVYKGGIGNTVVRLPYLLALAVSWPKIHKKYRYRLTSVYLLALFDMLICQMKYLSQNFERFAMYTGQCLILGLPVLLQLWEKSFTGKIITIPKEKLMWLTRYVQIKPEGLKLDLGTIYNVLCWGLLFVYFNHYLYRWAIQSNYGIMPFRFWGT